MASEEMSFEIVDRRTDGLRTDGRTTDTFIYYKLTISELKSEKNQLKIVISVTALKNRCILHGRVFLMFYFYCIRDLFKQSKTSIVHLYVQVVIRKRFLTTI